MNLKNIKKLSIALCLVLLCSSALAFNIATTINAQEKYKPQLIGEVKGAEVIVEDLGTNKVDTDTNINRTIMGEGIKKLQVQGVTVFCIEPMTMGFINGNYTPAQSEKDYTKLTYTEQKKISKLIFWGYEQNPTDMNYAIVQIMIWEELGYQIKYSGTVSDVTIYNEDFKPVYEAKKKDIQALVDKHDVSVSFDNTTKNVKVGDTITLTDTKGVLKDFQTITSSSSAVSIVSRTATTLTLKVNSYTSETVIIKGEKENNKNADNEKFIFYNPEPNSQDVMKAGKLDPVYLNVNINIEKQKGSIKVIKYEDDGIENSYTGKLVEGTKFVLSANADMSSPIGTYTTDKNGVITIEGIEIGDYYLQETSTQAHLEVDSTIHPITVKEQETATKIIYYKDHTNILQYISMIFIKNILNKIY